MHTLAFKQACNVTFEEYHFNSRMAPSKSQSNLASVVGLKSLYKLQFTASIYEHKTFPLTVPSLHTCSRAADHWCLLPRVTGGQKQNSSNNKHKSGSQFLTHDHFISESLTEKTRSCMKQEGRKQNPCPWTKHANHYWLTLGVKAGILDGSRLSTWGTLTSACTVPHQRSPKNTPPHTHTHWPLDIGAVFQWVGPAQVRMIILLKYE